MNYFVSEFKYYSNIKCFHVKYGVGRFFAKVGGFWNVIGRKSLYLIWQHCPEPLGSKIRKQKLAEHVFVKKL